MNNFKAVIFDMDGLLLDSERLALESFNSACNQLELGDLSELFNQCVGTNSELGESILVNGLEGLVPYEVFSEAWDDSHRTLTEQTPIPLKTGVQELLQYIRALGIATAVATSTNSHRAKQKLGDSGILDFFDLVVGGDQVSRSKPDPEIYLRVATELGVKPSECLALEDSPNGVRSALAAGMTVVQIPDLIQPDEELIELGHVILSCLSEVQAYDFRTRDFTLPPILKPENQ